MSDQQQDDLQNQQALVMNESTTAIVGGLALEQQGLATLVTNLSLSVLVAGMTSQLGPFRYFDAVTDKIVIRP